jgi:hypothetical protein
MVEINPDPHAGGNRVQPPDGRDEQGRLPEPLDAAHFGSGRDDSPEIVDLPGMPASQPAGTGPVVSAVPDDQLGVDVQQSPAAQGVIKDSAVVHPDRIGETGDEPHVQEVPSVVADAAPAQGVTAPPASGDKPSGGTGNNTGTAKSTASKKA